MGGGTDLFLSVGVDEDVVSAPSCQRLVADDTINGTDARYVLLATDAVLQQATVYTTVKIKQKSQCKNAIQGHLGLRDLTHSAAQEIYLRSVKRLGNMLVVLTSYVPLSDLPGEHLRIFGFAFADTLYHVRCCHLGLTASDLTRVD